jgi:uncharacterized protein DUF5670
MQLARHICFHGHVDCSLPGKLEGSWERLERGGRMLWTIFVILVVMWLLGMVSGATLGGFIHLLLLLAIAVVLIRIIGGRAPV